MEVHKILGNGFQEVIYQRALEKEFIMGGISFRQEFEMPIFYKDEQIKTRRVDFLVEEVVSIELKAIYFIRRCTSRPGHKLFKSLQSRNWNVNKFWSEIITI